MAALTSPAADIESFLHQNEEKELLRFTTAGSVDDGKSTLIGRLLYDSKGVYEDQISSVHKASRNGTRGQFEFALLTDGLRAEREQGITIDVAYRYFSTPKRKFIIADTPGHEQYTRNMATGASTANLAIILVDARNGVMQQSRRHAYLSSLLGIQHIVVAVNKMDLVDFRQEVFEAICEEFQSFATRLDVTDLHFIPISALLGDNVVEPSARMSWFHGGSLLEYLENVPVARDRNLQNLRFPVQYVLRPDADFRGYAGQVVSGIVKPGDEVAVLPSGRRSRVRSIVTYDGDLPMAFPPMSVTMCLEDELDISRGDVLAAPDDAPGVSRRFEATVVWMNEKPLDPGQPYLIKHTTRQIRGTVAAVHYKVNVTTLENEPARELRLNEIGCVTVETFQPLVFDAYRTNRATGSFILIDPISNATLAAGMIRDRAESEETNQRVTPEERAQRWGHSGAVVWLKGSVELAFALERTLFDRGCMVHVMERIPDPTMLPIVRSFSEAGFITICVLSEQQRAGTMTDHKASLLIDSASLPPNQAQAVEEVCRNLLGRGLLQNHTKQ